MVFIKSWQLVKFPGYFKNFSFCSGMLEMYSKRSKFKKIPGVGGGGECTHTALETGASLLAVFPKYSKPYRSPQTTHDYNHSKQK